MSARGIPLADLLDESSVDLHAVASSRDEAIRLVGRLLVATGAVDDRYIDAMLARERSVSTYVGEGVAVPHGTNLAKEAVARDALALLRLDEAIDWGGEQVTLVIAIAAPGRGYIGLLSRIARMLLDADNAAALRHARTYSEVCDILAVDNS